MPDRRTPTLNLARPDARAVGQDHRHDGRRPRLPRCLRRHRDRDVPGQLLLRRPAGPHGLGAKEVTAEQAPQLINAVQELTIAAGIPTPRVYIIDDTAPNAFATGRDPKRASVAITTGLLQKLDREELQGVIGHELSHVRNYDIRHSLLVGVLVGTIALLADFFLRVTFWGDFGGRQSPNRNEGGSGGFRTVIFVIAIVLAILAPIFAGMVQLAVSRQREYLADASSVGLTRNPHGLERALAKIAEDKEVLEVATAPPSTCIPRTRSGSSRSGRRA